MEEGEEKIFVTEKEKLITLWNDPLPWWDVPYDYPQWTWSSVWDNHHVQRWAVSEDPINLAWENTNIDRVRNEILEEPNWVPISSPFQQHEQYVYDPELGDGEWIPGEGVADDPMGWKGRYHARLWQMFDGDVVANAHHDCPPINFPFGHEADQYEEAEELVAGFFTDSEWKVYKDSYWLDNPVDDPWNSGKCTQIYYFVSGEVYVPDDYPTIQAAVDAVNAGDTIIVRDGTYTENVNVNKRLTIKSENGADSTIVQAADSNDHVFEVTADDVTISGFMVTGARKFYAGIYLGGADNCIITDNKATDNDICIYLDSSSNNNIRSNNANSNNWYGIYLSSSNYNMITNNDASHNRYREHLASGIILLHSSSNTVSNNSADSNNGYGIGLYYSNSNSLLKNSAKSNTDAGIHLSNSENNSVKDNKIESTSWDGIVLPGSFNNLLRNNTVKSSGRDGISGGSVNRIYFNNFIDNNNVHSGITNYWNSPEQITYTYNGSTYTNFLGNYWSDYTGNDANNDGIGDTPYPINSDNDNYPLVEQFENYEIGEDTTPPTVTTVSPEDGAPDVAIDTVVTATFSEAMDSSSITKDSFTLAGSAVSGAVTYDSDTYTATFTPDANLEYDHEYTATLSTDITDKAGNPLAEEYGWRFRTTKIEIGAIAKVINTGDSGLRIHKDDPTGETLKVVPDGWTFKIIGGPQYDIQDHNWWQIQEEKYEPSSIEGWVAEDFLRVAAPDDLVPGFPPDYFVSAQDTVEQAIEWAESNEGSSEWEGECLKFVREAFQGEPIAGWTSAEAARQQLEKEGKFYPQSNCWNPPRGALVFFSALGEYQPLGHVGLYLGNGGVVHSYDKVRVDTTENGVNKGIVIVERLNKIDSYIGWAYPPVEWLGQPPDLPTLLSQYKIDGTEIPVGGTTDESTVIFKGVVNDPNDDQVKLQVELRRLDEYEGNFIGEFTQESEWFSSGSEASITVFGLVPGAYHWQARALDEHGDEGKWKDYGNNDVLDADFIVSKPASNYFISNPPDLYRGAIVIPENVFPEGKGDAIPIYVPTVIDGSNTIREDDNWKTVKEIEKTNIVVDLDEAIAGFKPTGAENPAGSSLALGAELIKAIYNAISIYDLKIIIQKNSEGEFRAIIQVGDPESKTFIRKYAGEKFDPTAGVFWLIKSTYSKFIKNNFNLEPDNYPFTYYTTILNVDPHHEDDEYIGYLSVSQNNEIILTPKVYSEDELDIVRINLLFIEEIAVLEGDSYVSLLEGKLPSGIVEMLDICVSKESAIILQVKCPIEPRIYNFLGNITGLVNGEIKEEIPHSIYESENMTIVIFSPSDSYRYEVVGTEEGTYGLRIISVEDGEVINFTATDIPTAPGAVHQYTIDWEALSQGEQGVTVQIDNDGDGVFEQTFTTGNTFQMPIASFTYSPGYPLVEETITFDASNSYDPDGTITKYEWNFGDGNISDTTEPLIIHSYASAGDYTVNLTVTDDDGATSSTSQLINVSAAPLPVLKIEKTSSPNQVSPGGTLTYTIEYCIEGGPATNVIIVENYPKAVTFISADPAPDAGTNNKWTIGTLPAGSSGQIIIKVKVPESRDLAFTESGTVTGEGFVMVSKDISTEQKPYSLKNVVTLSCAELAPVSASAITTVSGVPGTSLELTEHGSGIYSSDEILNLQTKNKSIMLQKSTEAEYQPTSFNFSDGFAVNFATRWMQDICARNMVMGDAMHKKIKDASYIKDETITEVGGYRTSMEFESSFYGAAHIGTVSKSAKTSEDYIGAFEITWAGREECTYLFNWSRVPGNDSEKVIQFLVDVLDLDWAENATITKSVDEMSINITDDGNTATITIDANKETATVKVGGEIIYILEVRIEDDTLNIYDCKLEQMDESVTGIGYVMLDKDLASGQMQVREHGSGLYSSDMNFESGRLDKVTEAEYQPTSFNFSDGFDVNFSSKWVQGICAKNEKAGTAIHKKISDATSMVDDTTATKSSMEFETSFNGSMHIGARTKGTRISEDYIGVFNITELIKIGKPAISTPSTPTPDWLPCPFPEPAVSTPQSDLECPCSDP